uniref:Uncharacterized protein n=1 Tax=Trichuris muris TaxID=70415 RepID=A0A5S6QMG9_TRIMR
MALLGANGRTSGCNRYVATGISAAGRLEAYAPTLKRPLVRSGNAEGEGIGPLQTAKRQSCLYGRSVEEAPFIEGRRRMTGQPRAVRRTLLPI